MVQEILVGVLVLVSAFYLIKMSWIRFFKKDSSCDSCAMGKPANHSSPKN